MWLATVYSQACRVELNYGAIVMWFPWAQCFLKVQTRQAAAKSVQQSFMETSQNGHAS